jgi:hypothetical protein
MRKTAKTEVAKTEKTEVAKTEVQQNIPKSPIKKAPTVTIELGQQDLDAIVGINEFLLNNNTMAQVEGAVMYLRNLIGRIQEANK